MLFYNFSKLGVLETWDITCNVLFYYELGLCPWFGEFLTTLASCVVFGRNFAEFELGLSLGRAPFVPQYNLRINWCSNLYVNLLLAAELQSY